MKPGFLGAFAALVLLSFPGVARAAGPDERTDELESRHHSFVSPQHFALELRFSLYNADIDSDPSLHGATPYADTFHNNGRPELSFEFDYQAVRLPHFGTIGPGLSIGHVSESDPAKFTTPHNGQVYSQENSSLEVFPFYLVAVFRADVVTRELHIPLVPYAKLGLGMAFWRASNDGGTSDYQGTTGKGHSFGTQAALGVALDLNPFDSYAAREFDNSMGVNHTYIFFEYYRADLSGLFGQTNVLRVGTTTWAMGLAFEF